MSAQETPAITPHPAKFSDVILAEIRDILGAHLPPDASILDPFAGVGLIHAFSDHYRTFAIEIEDEWAWQSARRGPTWCGDFFTFGTVNGPIPQRWPGAFDAIVTSPTYANRMADKHTPSPADTSTRITYRHKLGRPLSDNNSGGLQWGGDYRFFHKMAWRKAARLLDVDGPRLLIVNVSNHVRAGEEVDVVGWHKGELEKIGFVEVEARKVATPRMGFGANREVRVDGEWVLVMRLER